MEKGSTQVKMDNNSKESLKLRSKQVLSLKLSNDWDSGDTCKKLWLSVCKSLGTCDVIILTVSNLRIVLFYVSTYSPVMTSLRRKWRAAPGPPEKTLKTAFLTQASLYFVVLAPQRWPPKVFLEIALF